MIRQETAVNEEHAENFPYVASYYWWYMGCQRLSGHQIIAFLRLYKLRQTHQLRFHCDSDFGIFCSLRTFRRRRPVISRAGFKIRRLTGKQELEDEDFREDFERHAL